MANQMVPPGFWGWNKAKQDAYLKAQQKREVLREPQRVDDWFPKQIHWMLLAQWRMNQLESMLQDRVIVPRRRREADEPLIHPLAAEDLQRWFERSVSTIERE